MLLLVVPAALGGPPGVIEPSALPPFPADGGERADETCEVEWISDADGRMRLIGVTGCPAPFERAVRDALPRWTWAAPEPPDDGPVDATHALLTGRAGVPGGLYTRFGVRFARDAGGSRVTLVPDEVIRPRRHRIPDVPDELWSDVGRGCTLLVHVDEEGRTERVQGETCPERVRAALELPLMDWTWEPLVVEGERRAFAATYRVLPD